MCLQDDCEERVARRLNFGFAELIFWDGRGIIDVIF